jgi:hypothetical protein
MNRWLFRTPSTKPRSRKKTPAFEWLESRLLPCVDELGVGTLLSHATDGQEPDVFPAVDRMLVPSGSTGSTSATTATASTSLPLPALSSLPHAPATLYLNFGGDFLASWLGYGNISIPAFDTDGDGAPLSQTEVNTITQVWQIVAENYAPFNLNVTTVAPPGNTPNVSQIDIGGDGAWMGTAAGGIAQVGGLGGSMGSNPARGFVFPANLANGNSWYTGKAASHESGHTMGLVHQSAYSGTTKTTEYYSGPGDGTAPILGYSYSAVRGMWWYGRDSNSSTSYQDDMAVIAGNGFGYRASQAGNSLATAAPLIVSASNVSASNVLTNMSEQDYWSFVTDAGTVSVSVTAPSYGNLHPKIEMIDSLGNTVVGWQDPDASSVSWTGTLAAGAYGLVVASHGRSSLSTSTSYGFDVGSYSINGTLSTPTNLVAAPTNLTATAVSTSQIKLAWMDNATNETSYSVERSTDGTTWSQIASLGANSTSYSDTGLATGVTYAYRVRAFGGTTSSAYSNWASATTTQSLPAAPSNLVATRVSATRIHVTWTDNANNETGYAIERAIANKKGTPGTWTQITTVGASASTGGTVSFDDTTVTSRKLYSYRVRAYNAAGYSAYTNTTPPLAGGPTLASQAQTGDASWLASFGHEFWLSQMPVRSEPTAETASHNPNRSGGSSGDHSRALMDENSLALHTSRGAGREDGGAHSLTENKRVRNRPGNVFTGSEQFWLDRNFAR